MGGGASRHSKTPPTKIMETKSDDDDEQPYGAELGHPALYHEQHLNAQGEELMGWYADGPEDEHVVEDLEGEGSAAEVADFLPAAGAPPQPPVLDREDSHRSLYGKRVQRSGEDAASLVPTGLGGLKWHAQIIADWYEVPAKHCRDDGSLKPRRPMPQARAAEFLASLSQTADGRYIFTGVLNGWPALTNLELVSLTLKARGVVGKSYIKRLWNAGDAAAPAFPSSKKVTGVRATLRAAPWTSVGFSAASPGFAFWYARDGTLAYGEDMLRALRREGMLAAAVAAAALPQATRVHHFAHRYASEKESAKDRLVYHTALLIEWDHGRHTTVIELAWLGGLGGYGGKSNWYDDRDAKRPALYNAMPVELKMPWRSSMSEVRLLDVPHTSLADFQSYLAKYNGPKGRFLDPTIVASADVRLSHRSQADIFRYVLNYVRNATHYSEQTRSCQTFAADFYCLLSGDHSVEPFHAVSRVLYKRHLDWLLCEPS